jgi:phosphate/sulfate permease
MNNKSTNSNNVANRIGVCTAIGAALFAATNEPTWIAVGVAIGAALGTRKPKGQKDSE